MSLPFHESRLFPIVPLPCRLRQMFNPNDKNSSVSQFSLMYVVMFRHTYIHMIYTHFVRLCYVVPAYVFMFVCYCGFSSMASIFACSLLEHFLKPVGNT